MIHTAGTKTSSLFVTWRLKIYTDFYSPIFTLVSNPTSHLARFSLKSWQKLFSHNRYIFKCLFVCSGWHRVAPGENDSISKQMGIFYIYSTHIYSFYLNAFIFTCASKRLLIQKAVIYQLVEG